MSHGLESSRLAVLVHEVRSPVAALAAIAEAVSDPTLDASLRRDLVRLAGTACRSIGRIVADAAMTALQREELDPAALVREAASAWALGGARVEARAPAGLPTISGDPIRLRQALDNLISNALTHSGPDDVVVVVEAAVAGDGVLLSVSDSGRGLPLADQERVLEAGVRLDPESPGSGLGLSIVRAIVVAHAGSLSVDSVPGAGATFTIALPLG